VSGALWVGSTLNVAGSTTLSSNLAVTGTTTLSSTSSHAGKATFTANIPSTSTSTGSVVITGGVINCFLTCLYNLFLISSRSDRIFCACNIPGALDKKFSYYVGAGVSGDLWVGSVATSLGFLIVNNRGGFSSDQVFLASRRSCQTCDILTHTIIIMYIQRPDVLIHSHTEIIKPSAVLMNKFAYFSVFFISNYTYRRVPQWNWAPPTVLLILMVGE
jgi:hypothetical protein